MPTADGHALIAELETEGDQNQEIYARFGLAIYYAQVLETDITNLIAFSERAQGRLMSFMDIDARFEELWRKTFGALIKMVDASQLLGTDELELLQRALAERNRMTHRFWRDEIENMFTAYGRQLMLDQCDAARNLFMEADEAAKDVVVRFVESAGMSEQTIANLAREEILDVRRRHAEEVRRRRQPIIIFGAEGLPTVIRGPRGRIS